MYAQQNWPTTYKNTSPLQSSESKVKDVQTTLSPLLCFGMGWRHMKSVPMGKIMGEPM